MKAPEGGSGVTSLPDGVRSALLRGLGAYLRSVPRNELVPGLRRFAGFRQQALARHRGDLLPALDRPETRGAVLEWLGDGSHHLSAGDAELLREVCERPEGWWERVATQPTLSEREPARLEEAVREEKEVARRAREDARRAREDARRARAEARRSREAEQALGARLETELASLRSELEAARRELSEAHAERARAAREGERELRRAQRERDRATATAASLRAELKQQSREVAALKRAVAGLERALEGHGRREPRPGPSASRRRARRPPLAVAPGRLPDDVDTLDEWLLEPDVRLLVDGYNVTKAPGGFGGLDLPTQRERLIEEVERLARRRGVPATVVFDGSRVAAGSARRHRGTVDVHYSRPPESADDHLVAVLESWPATPVVVVTNDRELQARVRALGATVAHAGQLLGLIRV
jgi:predicted RNA-binding protein with PIN domain